MVAPTQQGRGLTCTSLVSMSRGRRMRWLLTCSGLGAHTGADSELSVTEGRCAGEVGAVVGALKSAAQPALGGACVQAACWKGPYWPTWLC